MGKSHRGLGNRCSILLSYGRSRCPSKSLRQNRLVRKPTNRPNGSLFRKSAPETLLRRLLRWVVSFSMSGSGQVGLPRDGRAAREPPFLFVGPGVTGKTVLTPMIARGFCDDLDIIAPDGEACSVDAVRRASDGMYCTTLSGGFRVWIVNEAQAMPARAVQAWLTDQTPACTTQMKSPPQVPRAWITRPPGFDGFRDVRLEVGFRRGGEFPPAEGSRIQNTPGMTLQCVRFAYS